ncbi:MAG: gephyrin-like molybdotransferase Glp [Pseudomonadota bacterium]
MISTAEALGEVLGLVAVVGTEEVPLAAASGRVLRADARASRDQPPFAASAMDGYALCAADAVAGTALPVVGEAAAGRRHLAPLEPGTAIRIFTGAPLPQGANSILIQEDAIREGDRITVTSAPEAGDYIRPAGMDFPAGFAVVAPRRLTPRDIALLAAMNVSHVTVARQPEVALVPTGDELVWPGESPGPDQIVSSNAHGLAAAIAGWGCLSRLCPIARDTEASLLQALDHASGADIVVSLGGASVGDHDLVAKAWGAAGLSRAFYKVAMRPGKPLMAGRVAGSVMLGLPGNPVSAMVCGEIFLRPALDAMLGLPAGPRPRGRARLATSIEANGPREHYMRAALTDGPDGPLCSPATRQDSNLVATLAASNALAIRPPNAPVAPTGSAIDVIRLD